jgi:hypothetical protein
VRTRVTARITVGLRYATGCNIWEIKSLIFKLLVKLQLKIINIYNIYSYSTTSSPIAPRKPRDGSFNHLNLY